MCDDATGGGINYFPRNKIRRKQTSLEHSKGEMCYDVNLSYELSKALHLLLLDIYDNDGLNKWFEYRRERFNYNDILKKIKSDRISRKIVINAWNVYAPCKKSKLLKIGSLFSC